MNLTGDMNGVSGHKRLSDEDLEVAMRELLQPLIDFLEQAENFDDGYPDQFPKDKRIDGQAYHDNGLNIDHHGWTLKPMVHFNSYGEQNLGRAGHGRFLTVTAFAQEHVFNEEPGFSIDVVLYESGKVQFKDSSMMSGVSEDIKDDFDLKRDILKVMNVIVSTYLKHSYQTEIINNSPIPELKDSRAYERSLALAEGALLIYEGNFSDEVDVTLEKTKALLKSGFVLK